ncbi:hypothetical protein ebA4745 [Aromatoleum aromaticum EbN1]|uniref:Uncharacterized protein n=1 Tax=Aromatoleum aromaticum (strain DSM 19018 / LMG 30748 / EbN1) TaxID=76114 RepID=Q5P1K7_AROAE|nr:hypothetical protein ebA4745 [Aromatoleum aromaticum EbN1]
MRSRPARQEVLRAKGLHRARRGRRQWHQAGSLGYIVSTGSAAHFDRVPN